MHITIEWLTGHIKSFRHLKDITNLPNIKNILDNIIQIIHYFRHMVK